MSRYNFAEGILELPPGWSDQTVTMLVKGRPDAAPGATFSLVINREPISHGFAESVENNLAMCKRTLPGFKISKSVDTEVGELPARDVEFHWRKDGMTVGQRIVFIHYPGTLVIVTLSAGTSSWTEGKEELESMLASMRFRKPEGAP
jgi:hypothetical protein